MKQVTQNMKSGKTELKDVPPPQCGDGEVLVKTRASLISAGTEKMLVDFASKSLLGKAKERPDLVKKVMDKLQRDGLAATASSVFSKLEEPLPLGYSAAGEVVKVGKNLKNFYQKGDRVVMAGAGLANHAEVNAIPKNLVAPLPDNVPYEEGAFATVASIALHGVRNAKIGLGDRILIMGVGLVGQMAVQLAQSNGAQVFAVDYDDERLKLAKSGGAASIHNLSKKGVESKIAAFTENKGFDAILVCAATDSNQPLIQAAEWARDRAKVVLVGKVGCDIPYADYMKKELQFVISRSYGPGRYDDTFEKKGQKYPIGWVRWTEQDNLAETARMMSERSLNVHPLISHTFPIEDAEDAYALVIGKEISTLGVVLTYSDDHAPQKQTKIPLTPVTEVVTGNVGLAAIGCGAFAKGVLLPKLSKMDAVSLTGITSKGGLSAADAGKRFDFAYATAKIEDILKDESTDAVLIATRHNTHADLVCKALKAGKHVFVEKPLALTEQQLNDVEKAYKKAGRHLMVGYNRRFAPLTQQVMQAFEHTTGPRQILVRVNAGKLEADNWQQDPEDGGGRFLGEACHFVDLACYLSGDTPENIHLHRGEGQDVYAITLTFTNNSIAQILYTSEGDASFSIERIEIFGNGIAAVIDNFRTGSLTQGGRTKKLGARLPLTPQNKGHEEELRQFVAAVQGEQTTPTPAEELFAVTRLMLKAI